MKLYEEIIFLKHFCKVKWCIENVISYYEPLIPPQELQRHYFWSNFHITDRDFSCDDISSGGNKKRSEKLGVDLSTYKIAERKDMILRNCVNPYLGLHILNESKKDVYKELFI